jgi:1-acyl-sn-glycerol-3-phosphate acyltransferase
MIHRVSSHSEPVHPVDSRGSAPQAAVAGRSRNPALSRAAHMLGSGFMFAAFGLLSVALFGVVLPIRLGLARNRPQRDLLAQRMVHRALRSYLLVGRWLDVFVVETRNAERLQQGPALVVANHPTLLDIVLLLAHMPQADCVAKREAWDNPFLRAVVAAAAYIPNDDGEELIASCRKRLEAGRIVVLFPEGTRSPASGLHPFRRGAAHLALSTGCEVVPVLLRCDPPSLKKGRPWYALPDERMRFRLEVDPPLKFAGEFADMTRGLAARRVTERLREHFERRLGDERAS